MTSKRNATLPDRDLKARPRGPFKRVRGTRTPSAPSRYSTELKAAQNGGGHVLAEPEPLRDAFTLHPIPVIVIRQRASKVDELCPICDRQNFTMVLHSLRTISAFVGHRFSGESRWPSFCLILLRTAALTIRSSLQRSFKFLVSLSLQINRQAHGLK
jgi:hypothetical protein